MPVTLTEVSTTDKYAFYSEWFDVESSILRQFFFFYFPYDGTIEMYDRQRNKRFLKRTSVEGIEASDIYVGNTIKIFNRQVKLTDYANSYTRRHLGETMQKTFVMLKPDAVKNKSKIIKQILEAGYKICNLRMLKISSNMISDLFSEKKSSQDYPLLMTHLGSGPVIVMQLIGPNAVQSFQELAGPEDPESARKSSPDSLRSMYGNDSVQNVLFCASSIEEADRFSDFFFGKNSPPAVSETSTVVLKDSSCCIVKPHAIRNGHLGEIMCAIEDGGYTITALQMFYVDHVNAEEFFEVYKGVTQEYCEMVSELISGACVAMEITGPMGEDTPQFFRTFVGPSDPDIARQLRPNTLRAIFGEDKIKNGLHVTDLPEDAMLEVEYFFKILS